MLEGTQHPDRDAQFRHINDKVRRFHYTGDPVISVDTKKELVGTYKNAGPTWRPRGTPRRWRPTTSPTQPSPRRCPTGCTTWAATRPGCRWDRTTTPPPSRSRPCDGGGGRSACLPTRGHDGCSSAPMREAPTATACGSGSWSSPGSPRRSPSPSTSATSLPAPRSGTRWSTGSSQRSR
jgi:hypothetical protein